MSVFQKAYEAECVKNSKLESENRRLLEAVKYADQLIIYWQNMEDDELPDGSIIDKAYDDWIKAKEALHPTDTEKGASK